VADAELENHDLGLELKSQDSMVYSNGTNQHDTQLKNECSLNSRIDDNHIAMPPSSKLDAEIGKYDGRLDTEPHESIAYSKGMQPHTNARNVFTQFSIEDRDTSIAQVLQPNEDANTIPGDSREVLEDSAAWKLIDELIIANIDYHKPKHYPRRLSASFKKKMSEAETLILHSINPLSRRPSTNEEESESKKEKPDLDELDSLNFSKLKLQQRIYLFNKIPKEPSAWSKRISKVLVRDISEKDENALLIGFMTHWTAASLSVLTAVAEKEPGDFQKALQTVMTRAGLPEETARLQSPEAHKHVWLLRMDR